ncbi:MAG: hypothetical protein HYW01_03735 [Deltaproteobacteria bacterium]|nr:hypothetical protein [Deltaproteobacteria bacterium]
MLSSNYTVSSAGDFYEKESTQTVAVIIVVVLIGFLITIAAVYFFFRILFSKTEKDKSTFEIMKKQETIRSGRGKVKEIQRLHLKSYSLRPNDLRRKVMISLISAAYHFGSWRKAVESSGVYHLFGRGNKKNKE